MTFIEEEILTLRLYLHISKQINKANPWHYVETQICLLPLKLMILKYSKSSEFYSNYSADNQFPFV